MNSETYIPIKKFGKDHWSTFAYIETRIVDHKGEPNKDHMRTDPDRHPQHMGERKSIMGFPVDKHPTRLKGYFEDRTKNFVENHDDWDCVDDLISAGLLKEPPDRGTGLNPVYALTELGVIVASQLRVFKGGGGNFAEFEPDIPDPEGGSHES